MIVTEENKFPAETATSKYSPDVVTESAPAGFDPYWATVSAPTPVALAVVPSFVAVAVPVELPDVPFAELTEPAGGIGAVGDIGVCDPGAIIATVGEAVVIDAPPIVPVMVAVPVVVGEVNVAV